MLVIARSLLLLGILLRLLRTLIVVALVSSTLVVPLVVLVWRGTRRRARWWDVRVLGRMLPTRYRRVGSSVDIEPVHRSGGTSVRIRL